MVEFAILAPVLILALLLAVDLGRVLFSYIQITNAAREGAAYGITHPDDEPGVRARAIQETNAQSQFGESGLLITVTCTPSGSLVPADCRTAYTSSVPNRVEVTVAEPFTFLTPGLATIMGNFTMNASATAVSLGAAGIPADAAQCVTVPDVVTPPKTPSEAVTDIEAAGLVPNGMGDLPTGPQNQVMKQLPVSGQCVDASKTIVTFHYRP